MKKFLFDLFPLLLFFVAYSYGDIYLATGVAIATSVALIGWVKLRGGRVDAMQWITLGVIVVFGGLTLWLHNDVFIKWKPTVLYWIFGAALLLGRFVFKQDVLRRLMGSQLELADAVWARLNVMWASFFLAAGVLNLYVAFSGHFTEAQWVKFKVFGLAVLTIVFVIGQSFWLGRHMPSDEQVKNKDA
jgi:intracellular septation protein